MSLELVNFIPPGIRLEMAQRIIKKMGIRPLAREIGVNPKSVYKYKQGSARPGNEAMTRILAVVKREDPALLEEYLDKLRENFFSSLETPIEPAEILSSIERESAGRTSKTLPPSREKSVARKPTPRTSGEVGVTEKATEEASLDEICEKIGVSSPFNRMKIEKITNALSERSGLRLEELVERTGLSGDAAEKYLEKMISESIVGRDASGAYKLSVDIKKGD